MAKLYFRVGSDWEEVVRLREEITKLQSQLRTMDANKSPAAVARLNRQINQAQVQMRGMVSEAAKAAVVVGDDLKSNIYKGSQAVNDFTQKIINQKAVVKDIEADVRRLTDAYRSVRMNPLKSGNALGELNAAKRALNEEKAALFGLTQEQANARLSVRKLKDEYALYDDKVKESTTSTFSLTKALGVIGGMAALKRLGSEIINVRGQFQAMETSMQTLLGSKEKADALMEKVKEYAKISPLELKDVSAATQMMLGFNIEAEKVPRFLSAIGDVSMGDTQKFNSLTLAFSQMSATGKLMGQDLNQMINAGFNPLQQMGSSTGKSISQLKDEMSKGAISTAMVQQAFIDATSAGGKFYQMSENASKTINGQLSMLQDSIDSVFNEMGKKSEGVIMSGIQMTTSLVENYETIGKILVGLVGTYGAYRAAVVLTATIEKARYAATLAQMAGYTTLGAITDTLRLKTLALNKAIMANPYAAVAVAIGLLVTAMWRLNDSTSAAEKAQKEYNKTKEDSVQKDKEHKEKLKELISAIQSEYTSSLDRVKAMEEIKKSYPSLFQKYIDEKGHIKDLIGLWKEYNEESSRGKVKENNETYQKAKLDYEQKLNNYNKKTYLANTNTYVTPVQAKLSAKKELDKAEQLMRQWAKDVRSDELAQWQLDLKKNTDVQIKTELSEMKRLQQARKNNPHYSLSVGIGSLKGNITESELRQRISILESETSSRTSGSETKNKSYWEKQKKEAESALESIASAQKRLMDAGNFNGIDTKIVESYKKNSKLLKESEKELNVYGSYSKQDNEADKLRENQEKNNEELLSLRQKNQQDEDNLMEEGTEKKLAQIKADYDAQTQEIEKREKELAKRNKETFLKGLNANGLTSEQQTEIDKANKLNGDNRTKQENEVYKSKLQYMQDYLKEYGTFQQQKLAIAQEYNEKIAKSTDEWQKKSLEKQKNAAIQRVDINAIKQSIDWGSIFGEFGTMFKEQLQPTIDKLRAISTTDEFKSSSLQDQQILYDLINKLEQSSAVWNSDIFKRVSEDMEAYQSAMNSYIDAQNREKNAVNALASAKENLNRIEKSGGDTSQAKLVVKQAEESLSEASTSVQEFGAKVNETTSDLESSSAKAVNMFQSLESGLQGLTSGSLKGIGNGIMQLDKLFNGGTLTKDAGNAIANGFQSLLGKDSKASKVLSEALGNSGMAGEIISAILGILDVIGEIGISGIVTSLQNTIFNSVNKMLDDVLSGDIIIKPFKNATSHIGKILDTITFGGFSSWTNNGNEKETADKISALTNSNDALKTSIDELKDEIKGSNGSKSISAHNEARDAQKRYEENLRQVLDAQMHYHSAHRSNAHYWDLNDNSLNQVNKLLGISLKNSWSDFATLTADQMNGIRTHLPDIWSEMINQGKYGDRFKDDWNNYADQAGKAKELTDDLRENLAQISFDSLRDSFVDKLMDMRSDAASFADDFEEYMTRALLNFSIGDLLDDDLKKWYDSYTDTMNKQDGKLTDEQIDFYKKWWNNMVNKGLVKRDEVAKLTGYTGDSESSSQSSTSKGFQTMSQDTGEELNGRFTALQITGENLKLQSAEQTMSLKDVSIKAGEILTVNSDIRNIANDSRDILASSYLEQVEIRENTEATVKELKSVNDRLEKIENNTKNL